MTTTMIQVSNNTAMRVPVPDFLAGLSTESLRDLTWTDPSLGVQDLAWLPEVTQDEPFDPVTHRLGDETLEVDAAAGVVRAIRVAVELIPAEIAARRKSMVPESVTPRQVRQALTRAGLRSTVEAAVAAGDQDTKDWYEFATEFRRDSPVVAVLGMALNVPESQLDDLWILAGSL